MKDGMEEVRNARNTKLELEELKKKGTVSSGGSSAYKEEINRLQMIIAELQRNQGSSMKGVNVSNVSSGSKGNSYELEFKLYQAETRIESLEQELEQRSKSYARELATYKLKIAEKEAILDGFSHNNSYN